MSILMADHGIQPGRYQHYKGAFYVVYGTVRHSETEELLVLYRTDYQDKHDDSHWVRPYDMFIENIAVNGEIKARFKFVEKIL